MEDAWTNSPCRDAAYSSTVLNSSTWFRPVLPDDRTTGGQLQPTQSLRSRSIGKVVASGCERVGNFLQKLFRSSDRVADRELGFYRRRRGRRIVSDCGSFQASRWWRCNHVPFPVPRDRPRQPRGRPGLQQLFRRGEQLPSPVVHGVPLARLGRRRTLLGTAAAALSASLRCADARAGLWPRVWFMR